MKTKTFTTSVLGFAVALAFLIPGVTMAASTVTFDNQSGKPALVKLVGPPAASVAVESGKKESATVAPGHYFIKIRYGTPGGYSYSKGDEFDVTETATSTSDITITLHKVVAGNYGSKSISEAEFGPEQQERKEAAVAGSDSWTNDWTVFVKELTKEVTKNNYFVGNVNTAFLGKTVVWMGAVKEIKRPTTTDPKPSLVRVSMKAEDLVLKSATTTLDEIVLEPHQDEWATWKSVSVGDKVVFRTTLDGGTFPPKCVLTKMDGMGVNAGKTLAWINTKGGVCVKSEPARKQ